MNSIKEGNQLLYKNFCGKVLFDKKKKIFHGSISNTRYSLNFQGKTDKALLESMKNVIDTHLAWCKENAQHTQNPNVPWKGSQKAFLLGPGKYGYGYAKPSDTYPIVWR